MWTEVGRLVLLQLFLTELRCAEGKRLAGSSPGGGLASPPQRETRRGFALRRQPGLMRRAGCIFTHDSHLDHGSRPAGRPEPDQEETVRNRGACCRTRVQMHFGVKGENDVVKAQLRFRLETGFFSSSFQFKTLKLNCVSKKLQEQKLWVTPEPATHNRKKPKLCCCCGCGNKINNNKRMFLEERAHNGSPQ